MSINKDNIIYSEPVREIMGTPPSALTRWGTVVIFSVFILFILLSWLIRYPDLLPSQVEITTENPPATLVSKVSGRIRHIFVNDKDTVKKDQLLALLASPATMEQFEKLKLFTDTTSDISRLRFGQIPDLSDLGELQPYYGTFRKSLSDLENFRENDLYGSKIGSAEAEISELKKLIGTLRQKEKLQSEIISIEQVKYSRVSSLTGDSAIAQIELDDATQDRLQRSLEIEQIRLDISTENIRLINKEDMLLEYKIRQKEEHDRLFAIADESFRNLKARIQIWENDYLLISPVNGVVSFTRYWSENQTVNMDEPVLTIIPLSPGDYIGRIYLKMQKSGKVQVGQPVNIKLSGYPYLEYGMVRGIIRSKSLVPSGDAYIIEIGLPQGLNTLYGRRLEFNQNMQGTAEVITDDIRLLQKIIYPFRHLININRR